MLCSGGLHSSSAMEDSLVEYSRADLQSRPWSSQYPHPRVVSKESFRGRIFFGLALFSGCVVLLLARSGSWARRSVWWGREDFRFGEGSDLGANDLKCRLSCLAGAVCVVTLVSSRPGILMLLWLSCGVAASCSLFYRFRIGERNKQKLKKQQIHIHIYLCVASAHHRWSRGTRLVNSCLYVIKQKILKKETWLFSARCNPQQPLLTKQLLPSSLLYFAFCDDGLGLQSRMPLSRSAAVARNCESVDQLKLITGFPNINYSSSQTWIHVATQVKDYVKTRLLTLPGKNLVVAQK